MKGIKSLICEAKEGSQDTVMLGDAKPTGHEYKVRSQGIDIQIQLIMNAKSNYTNYTSRTPALTRQRGGNSPGDKHAFDGSLDSNLITSKKIKPDKENVNVKEVVSDDVIQTTYLHINNL
ncbi:14002_t:CDS:2 [Entrophospora sp. SA101]|nr:2210_t:CDS:2 [Entrophospora sp. SA101]CAJ0759383.1 14002_t:CDS:2 [Entrophospora sp. SA101]CAJ0830401.1 12888_t:CDS:2 [Entrophospora sp. SA101]CAJ0830622.1 6972_t:CDS:2 [Entrophospora sp. SA101]CAJ0843032.1 16718_t:CDS:2 [Entrophospora sp. SA101]